MATPPLFKGPYSVTAVTERTAEKREEITNNQEIEHQFSKMKRVLEIGYTTVRKHLTY